MRAVEFLIEAEAWQTSKGKNKNGGLNKKGVASYRHSHPGSHLQTAVTTKPSKLKKGSKSAKRRASFCARMKGMKKHRTSSKTAHDPNSRINKSLRKWHCESIEEMRELIMLGEQYISQLKERNVKKSTCLSTKHLGNSDQAQCVAKGLRPRHAHKVLQGKEVYGKKIKHKKYGGPLDSPLPSH
jgi:hypothetical protein